MAWIRRVRTTTGATAVQVCESVDGRRRVVAHVGSAGDEFELGLLMDQARDVLADHVGQRTLDLGPGAPVVRAPVVGAAGAAGLFPAAVAAPKAVGVEPSRVLATKSRLLFDTVAGVYDDLGFGRLGDDVFKDLVVARITEPTSLLDVDRVLDEMGERPASLSTRKRALARCVDRTYRDQLAGICFAYAGARGDLSLVLYDVTTLRTQAEREDEFRRAGFSKDRSVDPQIVVGLLVDRGGFPLEIACFEGNKAEKNTIIPVIEAFRARHGIGDVVIAADAGMLSAANLKALDGAGYRFIVGSRATKAPVDLESHYAWHGDFATDGQIVDTVTPKTGRNIDNDPSWAGEPIWDPVSCPRSWRAIWVYSSKRFAHDNKTVDLQRARALAAIGGDKPARMPRFVTVSGDRLRLDEASLARARRVAGLKGYVTNIPADVIPAEEVIARYHDLWHVEQSFRISKSDLAARPFFARKRDAIEAHLTIVFAALAITRAIQNRTGLSLRKTLRTLRPLRSATIQTNGVTRTLPPALNPDEQAIIDAITSHSRH
jgi:hypothetical protein